MRRNAAGQGRIRSRRHSLSLGSDEDSVVEATALGSEYGGSPVSSLRSSGGGGNGGGPFEDGGGSISRESNDSKSFDAMSVGSSVKEGGHQRRKSRFPLKKMKNNILTRNGGGDDDSQPSSPRSNGMVKKRISAAKQFSRNPRKNTVSAFKKRFNKKKGVSSPDSTDKRRSTRSRSNTASSDEDDDDEDLDVDAEDQSEDGERADAMHYDEYYNEEELESRRRSASRTNARRKSIERAKYEYDFEKDARLDKGKSVSPAPIGYSRAKHRRRSSADDSLRISLNSMARIGQKRRNRKSGDGLMHRSRGKYDHSESDGDEEEEEEEEEVEKEAEYGEYPPRHRRRGYKNDRYVKEEEEIEDEDDGEEDEDDTRQDDQDYDNYQDEYEHKDGTRPRGSSARVRLEAKRRPSKSIRHHDSKKTHERQDKQFTGVDKSDKQLRSSGPSSMQNDLKRLLQEWNVPKDKWKLPEGAPKSETQTASAAGDVELKTPERVDPRDNARLIQRIHVAYVKNNARTNALAERVKRLTQTTEQKIQGLKLYIENMATEMDEFKDATSAKSNLLKKSFQTYRDTMDREVHDKVKSQLDAREVDYYDLMDAVQKRVQQLSAMGVGQDGMLERALHSGLEVGINAAGAVAHLISMGAGIVLRPISIVFRPVNAALAFLWPKRQLKAPGKED